MTVPDHDNRMAALILCGGLSRRMGRPKYLLPFHGELLLPRMCRIAARAGAPTIVVAAPEQTMPDLPEGTRVIRDDFPGAGPLGGIATGLRFLETQEPGVVAAFVTSCDVPLLTAGVVGYLCDRLGNFAAVAVQDNEFVHPLCAVYRTSLADTAAQLLESGERRPRRLLESVPTNYVTVDMIAEVDPALDCLRNLNTPAEYEIALELSGHNR